MNRLEKFFLIWTAITAPLAMLLIIVGGFVSVSNTCIGNIMIFIGFGIVVVDFIIPYVIWNICGIRKLMKDED